MTPGWNPDILGAPSWELLQRLFPCRGMVTGEAALAGYWFHHRTVSRLELAVRTPEDLAELDELAGSTGLAGERRMQMPGFVRYDRLDLMLDHDVVLDPVKPLDRGVRADSLRDLAADRVLRLLGGGDAAVLVDLYSLSRAGVDLKVAVRDAARKDLGVTAAALAVVLSRARPIRLPDGLVLPVALEDLQAFVEAEIPRLGMQAYS
ncbi:MAG: hypothetical protein AB1758_01405 [Candidatus Eremiobacterota bacterium]